LSDSFVVFIVIFFSLSVVFQSVSFSSNVSACTSRSQLQRRRSWLSFTSQWVPCCRRMTGRILPSSFFSKAYFASTSSCSRWHSHRLKRANNVTLANILALKDAQVQMGAPLNLSRTMYRRCRDPIRNDAGMVRCSGHQGLTTDQRPPRPPRLRKGCQIYGKLAKTDPVQGLLSTKAEQASALRATPDTIH